MKDKMMPLPVRFDSKIMDRCKAVSMDISQPCENASEVARNAMEYGLRAMEDMLSKVGAYDTDSKSHIGVDSALSYLQDKC